MEKLPIENEKALLVGVIIPGTTETIIHEHLDELELLAETAGAKVIERITQKVANISPATFVGKGKAKQIISQAKELNVKLILFDDEFSFI